MWTAIANGRGSAALQAAESPPAAARAKASNQPAGLLRPRPQHPRGRPRYKQLIEDWQDVLPAQSVCLTVPLVLPSEYDEPSAKRRREWMRRYYRSRRASVAAQAAE